MTVLGIQLWIANPKVNTNGGFEFALTGVLSGTPHVQYSDDLKMWTDLSLGSIQQLPAVLRDDRPITAKQRYYRAVISP